MKRPLSIHIILFCFLLGCNNQPSNEKRAVEPTVTQGKSCIDSVMKQDSLLGEKRNTDSRQVPLSQAIRDYTVGIENINFASCPPAFTTAFQKHKEAWTAMTTVTDQYPAIRGELHELFQQLEKSNHAAEFKQHLRAVNDTWTAVEKASQTTQ